MSVESKKMLHLAGLSILNEGIDVEEFDDWLQGIEFNIHQSKRRLVVKLLDKYEYYEMGDLDDMSSSDIKALSKAMKQFGWEE